MRIPPCRVVVALVLSVLVPVVASAQTPSETQLAARAAQQPQSVGPLLDLAKFYADRQQLQQAQATLMRALAVLNEQLRVQGLAPATAPAPASPASPTAGVIRVGRDIKQPKQLKRVEPIYPTDAKAAGLTGMVILEAIIDTQGRVRQATVLRHVSPSIDQAALAAVNQWVYAPTLLNGVPVEVVFTLTVNFQL